MKKDIAPSYTVKEVESLLGISRATIRRYEQKGILIPFRIGRCVRYNEDILKNIMNL